MSADIARKVASGDIGIVDPYDGTPRYRIAAAGLPWALAPAETFTDLSAAIGAAVALGVEAVVYRETEAGALLLLTRITPRGGA